VVICHEQTNTVHIIQPAACQPQHVGCWHWVNKLVRLPSHLPGKRWCYRPVGA
jgi:hypothetical protein